MVTGLDYGSDPTNKFITTWFRRAFTVTNAALMSNNTVMWLRCDDGAVVYLNGTELFRSNLPDGSIEPSTLASAPVESAVVPQRVPTNLFLDGTNVLAVEVHQADPASEDMHFDLSLTAYLPPEPSVVIVNPGYYEEIHGTTVPLRACLKIHE